LERRNALRLLRPTACPFRVKSGRAAGIVLMTAVPSTAEQAARCCYGGEVVTQRTVRKTAVGAGHDHHSFCR